MKRSLPSNIITMKGGGGYFVLTSLVKRSSEEFTEEDKQEIKTRAVTRSQGMGGMVSEFSLERGGIQFVRGSEICLHYPKF